MTITVTIEKLGTTAVADVDLLGLDQTKLKQVAADSNGVGSVTEYVLADGSLAYDLGVTVRIAFNAKANNGFGETRYSWAINGRLTTTDDVLLTTTDYPVSAALSFVWPGEGITDVTEARQLINNLFCLTFGSVAAGVISDTLLTNLAYGITSLYG